MSYIRSTKRAAPARLHSTLAVPALAALTASLSLPLAAQTQVAPTAETSQATGSRALRPVTVEVKRDQPEFKADTSASPKLTQPLLDTPKTVQVLTKEVMEQQGATTMVEALRNTPGITLQLGENGNTSAGDVFQLRGFATQSSTLVDGLRDVGAVTRDVFNLEQIEVVKGPAGADVGRGAAGGYINLISKLPGTTAISEASFGVGTGDRKRATADINRALGGDSAFRLNLMTQDSGVDGRDFVTDKGTAIAPAIAFGLGTPRRIYIYSQHMRQHNVPDGGISTIGMPGFFNAVPQVQAGAKVNRENFYGSPQDYEKVDADMVTARIEYDLAAGTVLRNATRWGKSHMDRVLTGVNTIVASANPGDPSTWTVSRSRQRVDQTNKILANQTQINTAFATGGLKHDLAAGLELLREEQLTLGTGTTAQTINGVSYAAVAAPAANLYNPNPNDVLGIPYLTGADTDGRTDTTALYVFDTLSVGNAWKLSGGLRAERYKTKSDIGAVSGGTITRTALQDKGTLVSWNLGAVYKPRENGSIYAAIANAKTPPGSLNFTLSAAAGNQANAALDPQETTNYEIGTKWDLLDKKLNVALALYRADNEGQVTQDPVTRAVSQEGKTRVQGVELSAVGQITSAWQLSAGLATMKAKQLNQVSVNATSGVVSVTDAVRWTPELTATLWTSYSFNGFTLSGGLRHVSDQKRVVTVNAPASNMPEIPGYTVADAAIAYRVSKLLSLQMNVYNLFDKEYIATLNNGGSRMKLGAPRSVALTATLSF